MGARAGEKSPSKTTANWPPPCWRAPTARPQD